jgi:hypothetical protein
MPQRDSAQHFEDGGFRDRRLVSQLDQYPGVGVEGASSLDIAGIAIGEQRLPLRADEPSACLFRTHKTPYRLGGASGVLCRAPGIGCRGGFTLGRAATIRAAIPSRAGTQPRRAECGDVRNIGTDP